MVISMSLGTKGTSMHRTQVAKGTDDLPGDLWHDATARLLPRTAEWTNRVEVADLDGDRDLDIVLANWGPGNNMTNVGGRTLLWLNDGEGHFTNATPTHMPESLVRFSWDLEFVDFDNDFDLDVVVSCKRCGGGDLFVNDGSGHFEEKLDGLPQYTNNYDFEPMDLDGDGFLDLVTVNDGEIVGGVGHNRREHIFRNDEGKRFVDMTHDFWPESENIGEDDNNVVFLDYDSDGDADFIIASLTGADRLLINDGSGHLKLAQAVFTGASTPGTLSLVLADLDGDRRLDVVQGQGEHETAVEERVFLGTGLPPYTAPPVIARVEEVAASGSGGILWIRARVHDNKSPTMSHDWRSVSLQLTDKGGLKEVPMLCKGSISG